MIGMEALYGLGGFAALGMLAYLVYALVRAEEF
ncbi:MAG: potassium-transporting ATPase subunit F [Comamonadaceae bacterium]|nr:MAG: potassium-transporting ATPase subunit F [Comamonadaceae bacterium]